jgi:hypothetical protein
VKWEQLDESSGQFICSAPPEKIVILQAILESYEGAGIVRTVDEKLKIISVLTTNDQKDLCEEILKSILR